MRVSCFMHVPFFYVCFFVLCVFLGLMHISFFMRVSWFCACFCSYLFLALLFHAVERLLFFSM